MPAVEEGCKVITTGSQGRWEMDRGNWIWHLRSDYWSLREQLVTISMAKRNQPVGLGHTENNQLDKLQGPWFSGVTFQVSHLPSWSR